MLDALLHLRIQLHLAENGSSRGNDVADEIRIVAVDVVCGDVLVTFMDGKVAIVRAKDVYKVALPPGILIPPISK